MEVVTRGAAAQPRLSSRDRRDSRIEPGGTPGFWTLGLRAAVARGQTRLTAGLENLLDRGYREHGSGIDAPGRHVWVRVDIGR
jgi:outer membrane receptor protein involved in Fe transport